MIFNCLNCCRVISSRHEKCPYCMVEVAKTFAVEEKPAVMIKAPEQVRESKIQLVYSAMASVGQIVKAMRIEKRG